MSVGPCPPCRGHGSFGPIHPQGDRWPTEPTPEPARSSPPACQTWRHVGRHRDTTTAENVNGGVVLLPGWADSKRPLSKAEPVGWSCGGSTHRTTCPQERSTKASSRPVTRPELGWDSPVSLPLRTSAPLERQPGNSTFAKRTRPSVSQRPLRLSARSLTGRPEGS